MRILLAFFLFVATFIFSSPSLRAEGIDSMSPLKMKIRGEEIIYNSSNQEIIIPVNIKNNSSNFFDNLYYGIELYQGEALKEEGDLFGNLKYSGGDIVVLPKEGKSIGPNEEVDFEIKYTHKNNLNSGKYFFKLALLSDLNSTLTYSLDYSKIPFEITGLFADNLGFFDCYLSDGKSVYSPSMGVPMEKGNYPEIIMALGNDQAVIAKIKESAKKIYLEAYHNEIIGEVVGSQASQPVFSLSEPIAVNDGEKVEIGTTIKDKLNLDLNPGTYRIKAVLLDDKEKEITHACFLRYVVQGESARIGAINTSKGDYKKGETFDLKVDVFGPADESEAKASLEVSLFDKNDQEIDKITKEEIILGAKAAKVDFSDKIFSKNVNIKKIGLKVKGSNGDVLDERTFEYKNMPSGEAFNLKQSLIYLALIFGGIFLTVVSLKIWRKRRMSLFVLFLGVGIVFNLIFISKSFAQTYVHIPCYPAGLTSWYSQAETACEDYRTRMTVSVSASASNCMNGVIGSGVVGNASFTMPDKGHVLSATWGPYVGYGTGASLNSSYELYYAPGGKTLVNYPKTGVTTIYDSGCRTSGSISLASHCLFGSHEGSNGCSTYGWAVDQDVPNSSVNVLLYRDNPAGGGGTFVGSYLANIYRSDVNSFLGISGNHGFSTNPKSDLLCRSDLRDGKSHAIYAYGVNYSGTSGSNKLLTNSPKTVTCPGMPTLSFVANPQSIASGGTTILNWNAGNVAVATGGYCTASNTSGSADWKGNVALSGTKVVSPGASGNTYTLQCGDGCFSTVGNVSVSVFPAPTLNFSANPQSIYSGESSMLTWTSTNTNTCTASGGWSGGKAVSGSQSVSPSATTTYTMTCTGNGGSVSSSIEIPVLYQCSGTKPSAATSCPNDWIGVSAPEPSWIQVGSLADCTDSRKCEYYYPPIPGSVGSADGGTFCPKPTENLCSAGTASEVTESADGKYWEWTCSGINGGTSASGKALKSCAYQEVNPN